jgi:hypothetical protein
MDISTGLGLLAGAGAGWWIYLVLPGELAWRVAAAMPPLALGLVVGVVRIGERSLRQWTALALAYAQRPHILVAGDSR